MGKIAKLGTVSGRLWPNPHCPTLPNTWCVSSVVPRSHACHVTCTYTDSCILRNCNVQQGEPHWTHSDKPSLVWMPHELIASCNPHHPAMTAPLLAKLAPPTGLDMFCADCANLSTKGKTGSPSMLTTSTGCSSDHCCRRISLGLEGCHQCNRACNLSGLIL